MLKENQYSNWANQDLFGPWNIWDKETSIQQVHSFRREATIPKHHNTTT